MADLPPGIADELLSQELGLAELAAPDSGIRSSPAPSQGALPAAPEEPLFLPSPPPVAEGFVRVESSPSKKGSEAPAREDETLPGEGEEGSESSEDDSEGVVEEKREKEEKEKAKPWVS